MASHGRANRFHLGYAPVLLRDAGEELVRGHETAYGESLAGYGPRALRSPATLLLAPPLARSRRFPPQFFSPAPGKEGGRRSPLPCGS